MGLLTWALVAVIVTLYLWKVAVTSMRFKSLNKLAYVYMSPWTLVYAFFFESTEGLMRWLLSTRVTWWREKMVYMCPLNLVPYVLINGARQVEALLKSKNINKSREYDAMKPWLGEGLITSGGDYWRKQRRILTPTFHYEILHSYVGIFAGHGEVLIRKLSTLSEGGAVVNMWPLFNMCTLDGICEATIGRHFDAQGGSENEYAKAICRVTKIARERMQMPWMWNDTIFSLTPAGREQKRSLDIIHGFGDEIVSEKLAERSKSASAPKEGKRKMAFLELLADLHEEGVLTQHEIRVELDNFIFAGHDTSTMGLNWTIFLLGHHPEVQKKVQAELDTYIRTPADYNMDNLKNLTYLECCFKEALRLYPPVPLMGRIVTEPMTIGEVEIPVGTTVGFFAYNIHRDAEFWEDPEKFDPDRFLPENSLNRYPFSYIPFSAGSRNCIGQRFAILEAKTLLGMILQAFDVESVDERHSILPLIELVLRPEAPINLKLRHRQSPYQRA